MSPAPVLLLFACAGDEHAAAARAEAWLAQSGGAGVVQVGIDDPGRAQATAGALVLGDVDVTAALAPCGLPDGTRLAAELTLEPAGWPWEVDLDAPDGPASACVTDVLAHLPLRAPGGVGQADLVVIRGGLGKGEAEVRSMRPRHAGPVPPWIATFGHHDRAWDRVEFEDGLVRWHGDAPDSARPLAHAETWARRLTCPAATLSLVRTRIVLERGAVDEIETLPHDDCVEALVRANEAWMAAVPAGEGTLGAAAHAVIVLDVPVGGW